MGSQHRDILKLRLYLITNHFHFQVHDLEFAQIELQVVEGLKTGNESLKKMHQVKIQSLRIKKLLK